MPMPYFRVFLIEMWQFRFFYFFFAFNNITRLQITVLADWCMEGEKEKYTMRLLDNNSINYNNDDNYNNNGSNNSKLLETPFEKQRVVGLG